MGVKILCTENKCRLFTHTILECET